MKSCADRLKSARHPADAAVGTPFVSLSLQSAAMLALLSAGNNDGERDALLRS